MSPLVSLLIGRTVDALSQIVRSTPGWFGLITDRTVAAVLEDVSEDDLQASLDDAVSEHVRDLDIDMSDYISAADVAEEIDVEDVARCIDADDVASYMDEPEIDYDDLATSLLAAACAEGRGSAVFDAAVAALIEAVTDYAIDTHEE